MKFIYSNVIILILIFSQSCSENRKEPSLVKKEHILINKLFKSYGLQVYYINIKKDSKIIGKEGTIIQFSKESFNSKDSILKIELIECFNMESIILNNLTSCTTNDKLLQTSGMLKIQVKDKKGCLQLNNGIELKVPTKYPNDMVRIFKGINNTNFIDWEEINDIKVNIIDKNIGKKTKEKIENKLIQEDEIMIFSGTQEEFDSVYGTSFSSKKAKKPSTEYKIQNDIRIDGIKDENLIYYSFQTTNLDWINLDMYYNGSFEDYTIMTSESDTKSVFQIVLSENKSIIEFKPTKYNSTIKKLPKDVNFVIIGYDIRKDGVYFNMKDFSSKDKSIVFPSLIKSTRKEILKTIEEKFKNKSVLI